MESARWASSDNSYTANKIRFPAPVPVDSKVRGKAEVVSVDEVGDSWWRVVTRFTLEVESNEKPCFVGDSVTRVMAPPIEGPGGFATVDHCEGLPSLSA